MFLKNKCSALITWLNQPFSASGLRGKSHMEHNASIVTGFLFLHSFFLKESNSKNLGFIILPNQSFKVSMVNFNSIEKSSAKDVHFSLDSTAEVASFNCLRVIL